VSFHCCPNFNPFVPAIDDWSLVGWPLLYQQIQV